jgi:hypothetical protein
MQLDQQKELYSVRFQVCESLFISCYLYPKPFVASVHKSMSMVE